jgi:hypothetical protein
MGPEGRGTSILLKNDLEAQNLQRLPSGRGHVNLHTRNLPHYDLRTEKKKKEKREGGLLMIKVPKLIPTTPTELILSGDFNCTLASHDITGRINYSRALDTTIKTLYLMMCGQQPPEHPGILTMGPALLRQ